MRVWVAALATCAANLRQTSPSASRRSAPGDRFARQERRVDHRPDHPGEQRQDRKLRRRPTISEPQGFNMAARIAPGPRCCRVDNVLRRPPLFWPMPPAWRRSWWMAQELSHPTIEATVVGRRLTAFPCLDATKEAHATTVRRPLTTCRSERTGCPVAAGRGARAASRLRTRDETIRAAEARGPQGQRIHATRMGPCGTSR